MALLIFPVGVLLGWFIDSPKRAAAVTGAVGLAALVLYLGLGLAGVEVSPIEAVVLLCGTPIAAFLASRVARWRVSRRSIRR
jgi:hypothetical protein